jgi:hypothetical protein
VENNKLSVCFWPHFDSPKVASTRIRFLNLVDPLKKRGFDVNKHFDGRSDVDVLILVKRYDESSLKKASELRRNHGTLLFLDLCDNHFYFDESTPVSWQERARQLKHACTVVDVVVVSTEELGRVVKENVPHCSMVVIPDSIDVTVTDCTTSPKLADLIRFAIWRIYTFIKDPSSRKMKVIWFGNNASEAVEGGINDINIFANRLDRLAVKTLSMVTILSNNRRGYRNASRGWRFPSIFLRWSPWLFAKLIKYHQVSIIPVKSNAFTTCKSYNRVSTSVISGLYPIYTSVAPYREFNRLIRPEDWGILESGVIKSVGLDALLRSSKEFLTLSYSADLIADKWSNLIRMKISKWECGDD